MTTKKSLLTLALIVCVQAFGLRVGLAWLPRQGTGSDDITEAYILADTFTRDRPEPLALYIQTVKKNEKGFFESPAKEDIQRLADQWAGYASGLEVKLGFAQNALRAKSISVRRTSFLYWMALAFVIVNGCCVLFLALKCRSGDETVPQTS